MSLRPTRRTHHREELISLNITPFLDIMVSLILFLLSAAAFLKLAVIDSNLPKLVEVTEIKPEQQLIVTVKISNSGGFEINRVGEDANAGLQKHWVSGDLAGVIALQAGRYDFIRLNQQMIRIKHFYPQAATVMLLPAGEVEYENLVKTLDATREVIEEEAKPVSTGSGGAILTPKKHEFLFPDAVIGHVAEKEEGGGA